MPRQAVSEVFQGSPYFNRNADMGVLLCSIVVRTMAVDFSGSVPDSGRDVMHAPTFTTCNCGKTSQYLQLYQEHPT